MIEEFSIEKDIKNCRKTTFLETKKRRKDQVCKTYELKIDKSHLSKDKIFYLNRLFLEAKWLYNSFIASESIASVDIKNKNVFVLDRTGDLVEKELMFLSSQMRQSIKENCLASLKSLEALSLKNRKVGKLHFKSRINSIVLKQYGVTYKFLDNMYLSIQGYKKSFKVCGYKQIPIKAEIRNAILIRKASGIYLKVVCFIPRTEIVYEAPAVGIDFGIKTSLTLSNGEKFEIKFPLNDRAKRVKAQLNRKVKGSTNRYRQNKKFNIMLEKNTNRKKDARNKVVSYITKKFKIIVVQDESIHAWQSSIFKLKIQNSALGGIMSDLKRKSHTLIVVNKHFPSTKLCVCGTLNKISLAERLYSCACGYNMDRDIHSARNILFEGLKTINREPINTMLVEALLDLSTVDNTGSKH